MSSHNFYKYKPISASLLEIRICVLSPATDFGAPIYCRLEHVFLGKNPSYHALSYVWSDPPGIGKIYLPGKVSKHSSVAITVTSNLESALRHLRSEKIEIGIWIDAICINQNDKKEKGEQVPLMGMIYDKAESDLLWMGPHYRDYSLAMEIFDRPYNRNHKQASLEIESLVHHAFESASSTWTQICAFFRNIVWTRMWIVQELALAKEISVIFGRRAVPWFTIQHIARCISLIPRMASQITNKAQETLHGIAQVNAISSLSQGNDADLLQVWYTFGWCGCKIPQDKLFAILNLVSNLHIKPDYNLNPRELYSWVTKMYILQTKDLKILDYVSNGHALPTAQHLPSWAPDFGAGPTFEHVPFDYDISELASKNSDRPLLQWTPTSSSLIQRSGQFQLELIGIHLDIINQVWGGTSYTAPEARVAYFGRLAKQLEVESGPKTRYFTGELRSVAFEITICGGYVRSSKDYTMHPIGKPASLFSEGNTGSSKKTFSRNIFSTSSGSKKPPQDVLVSEDNRYSFRETIMSSTTGQAYAITNEEHMALVPDGTRAGDIICALNGRAMPYVLRGHSNSGKRVHTMDNGKRVEPDYWTCVGAAYMHGFMGVLPQQWKDTQVRTERRYLIV